MILDIIDILLPIDPSLGRYSVGDRRNVVIWTSSISKKNKKNLANYQVVEMPLIEIQSADNSLVEYDNSIKNIIISSQNAIPFIKKNKIEGNFYVVGKKTAKKLRKRNKNVVLFAHSAKELADKLRILPIKAYIFFCGNLKRSELKTILNQNHITVREVEVYQTLLTPKSIEIPYEKIVFLSPSAVESFLLMNTISENCQVYTIGSTTKAYLEQFYAGTILCPETPKIKELIRLIKKG